MTTTEVDTVEQVSAPAPVSAEMEAWRIEERRALALSKATEAIPKQYRGKPGDILAAWLLADELGIPRMAFLRSGYVVNGRPQLSGDLLLALARFHGAEVDESFDPGKREDGGDAFAECNVVTKDRRTVTATYSVADAVQAGLWQGSDVWKKYPKRMLQMRARGFALRDAIPEVLAGVYAPGELVNIAEQLPSDQSDKVDEA